MGICQSKENEYRPLSILKESVPIVDPSVSGVSTNTIIVQTRVLSCPNSPKQPLDYTSPLGSKTPPLKPKKLSPHPSPVTPPRLLLPPR